MGLVDDGVFRCVGALIGRHDGTAVDFRPIDGDGFPCVDLESAELDAFRLGNQGEFNRE